MEDLSIIVGVIGNIISVLMFLSPTGTFWRIFQRKSTEDFDSLPYICTFLNSSLWTYYGIIKPGAILVATVNSFGVLVETIFIVMFLIYAPAKMKARTGILVSIIDVGILAAALLVTQLFMKDDVRIDIVGFLGAGLNIIMYGSPLGIMKTVVTTKSVEFMPFFLSLFMFLNGGVWTFYAYLVKDIILGIPNGTGFLLGTAQLLLYAIYRDKKPSKSTYSDGLEGGSSWQQEPLLQASSQAQPQGVLSEP
ncbi:hypothetical protein Scep_030729 [Stephania cephalantha]|uniref:Bidirectional sugar transporter SWEET n=1 Tax=Stephania cephalantha TaxID=152367 RepID=A0AAP0E3D2_9MAGN